MPTNTSLSDTNMSSNNPIDHSPILDLSSTNFPLFDLLPLPTANSTSPTTSPATSPFTTTTTTTTEKGNDDKKQIKVGEGSSSTVQEVDLRPLVGALKKVKAIRIKGKDSVMHKNLAKIFADDSFGVHRGMLTIYVVISGLPSLTSNREAIDLSNPIWSGVKERVCCILHDLGDTWLDYVVIEGPYVTEESALTFLMACEFFSYDDGPINAIGLCNFHDPNQLKYMLARSKEKMGVVMNSWSPPSIPFNWTVYDICQTYDIPYQVEVNSEQISDIVSHRDLCSYATFRGLTPRQYLLRHFPAMSITPIMNDKDVQESLLPSGTEDPLIAPEDGRAFLNKLTSA